MPNFTYLVSWSCEKTFPVGGWGEGWSRGGWLVGSAGNKANSDLLELDMMIQELRKLGAGARIAHSWHVHGSCLLHR